MNIGTRLIVTSSKTALLSTILVCIFISFFDGSGIDETLLVFIISYIITFIISIIMILSTIFPIYGLNKKLTPKEIYNKYFPYYAVIFFVLIAALSLQSQFDKYTVAILIIAYLTAMQSWIWIFKTEENETEKTN